MEIQHIHVIHAIATFQVFRMFVRARKSCFVLYDLSEVSGTTNFHRHKCNLSLNNDFRCHGECIISVFCLTVILVI